MGGRSSAIRHAGGRQFQAEAVMRSFCICIHCGGGGGKTWLKCGGMFVSKRQLSKGISVQFKFDQEGNMSYTHLIIEVGEGFVGVITLNRPEQLNTFNSLLAEELTAALLAMDADPLVRVVLIKGAGKAFCAGIDSPNRLTRPPWSISSGSSTWNSRWWLFPE